MGTRSKTRVIEEGKTICQMYRQFDGYLTGHGAELWKLLDGMVLVNGMSSGDPKKIANGPGCLAAQIVSHFKEEPGGVYLQAPCDESEEYEYDIIVDWEGSGWAMTPKEIVIVTRHWGDKVFHGSVEEFKLEIDKTDL